MLRPWRCASIAGEMSAEVIVSYDGTENDEDAVALANLLAASGARLALAYVRHAQEWDATRELIAQHDAERRLERGALGLDDADVDRHVVFDASTPAGLERLAAEQDAQLIVFGSEYRTSPGRAEPGTSAQQLLDGGPVAVAVAAAGLRVRRDAAVRTIAVAPDGQDPAGAESAEALAAALGAEIVPVGVGADLIVVGSQVGGPAGRITLSGSARAALNAVRGSVLVIPCGRPLEL
jgi:nucleotide-binding universal stress UspA family protein